MVDVLNHADADAGVVDNWAGAKFLCYEADRVLVICVYRAGSIKSLNRNSVVQMAVNDVLKTGLHPPVVLDLVFSYGS